MQLNMTTDYGIRVVLCLAQNHFDQEKKSGQEEKKYVVSSSVICKKTGVPSNLMHKVVKPLKEAGILHEVRGCEGGFELNEGIVDNVTISTIIRAFEKKKIHKCLEEDTACCMYNKSCPIRDIYNKLQTKMDEWGTVKISELLQNPEGIDTTNQIKS